MLAYCHISIYSSSRICLHEEAMGTFRLVLKFVFILDLENIFYVSSFSRNLVSISKLINVGF